MTQGTDERAKRTRRLRAAGIAATGCALLVAIATAIAAARGVFGIPARELETPPGGVSEALAINDVGQVVGWVSGAGPTASGVQAVLWPEAGESRYVGPAANWSRACGINEAGQVVGSANSSVCDATGPTSSVKRAFLWTVDDDTRDLGALGGKGSEASDINDAGQVVGRAQTAGGQWHAFIWSSAGGMRDLGTLGGVESAACAINEAGVVVGNSENATGMMRPFMWDEAGGMRDMGPLPAGLYYALDINDGGDILLSEGGQERLVWSAGKTRPLLTPGDMHSTAYGINERREVVGTGPEPSVRGSHALVWSSTGRGRDLWYLGTGSDARGINGRGQVVGSRWRAASRGISVLGKTFFAREGRRGRACVWEPPKGGW